ncbi:hydroxymethylglutaryl-CoA lyase [Heyndrickxia sporothermodurans]|uniref:Hydroxymethylglutaryl-CoA lyase n=1 Tax=Heyndrickxia sporothermodurans TaxID=46224 RepID=A0A150KLU7_9BACI|nr:hydroxymethylglutaryl-CoA lyase [Heyndrickxia sporothermodurans]KYC95159.1 Hydroxymethylglutaryl-CoA lyase [Heyndrickxia sporothermodurans]MEB6547595.1 hydroxymethylglutaryl-CoA lyase [Heyndrickxia sporothermodurans]MED3650911.1 hydroxymethylglutaryl-CoA lyase [Heyndrickxia sporothermodurans]MED3656298.1 hydroxymethylglutaryl-CoA lyase [Heyndrickxia sporothermodurans]MED3699676.1 hydroxymethylglutaryl-CoA lyase [Heyndrickxia sporothermodurans]
MLSLPKEVTIIEVGPRDGLQNEKNFVPTETKLMFINKLAGAGIKEMELTSFVSPKWVPQMQDASEIVASPPDIPTNIVLAPNRKGIDRALELGCRSVAVFVGVSNSFNKKNINKSTKESLEELKPIITELKKKDIFVRACISTAFYCPFEGKVAESDTLRLCEEFVAAGVDELSVADTIGMAAPSESFSLFSSLKERLPNVLLTAHFHDTRKMALANIFAALQAGIDRFDTSAGGLGGCPFAPGATGNVATEDVVYMLERMGISTGIDLTKLVEAIDTVSPALSRKIESGYYQLSKK